MKNPNLPATVALDERNKKMLTVACSFSDTPIPLKTGSSTLQVIFLVKPTVSDPRKTGSSTDPGGSGF